jgi:hypothetical protein
MSQQRGHGKLWIRVGLENGYLKRCDSAIK